MRILITGGAGFIGINCAIHFAKKGHHVVIYDNLSRIGSEKNLQWIKSQCMVEFIRGDVRIFEELIHVITKKGPFDLILHMAAQVAVTTSVLNPREDFEINALGTFNLLEVVRLHNPDATIIYTSTNKVYGEMKDLNIIERDGRYMYQELPEGVDEKRNLDFHSPYGCSKGAADQYCIDYYRIYSLKTIILRQSCIYGYRQFGIEDQGWVAHFMISSVLDRPLSIYGNGKQTRDILFIDDLIRAFELATDNIDVTQGQIYNIGGGTESTISLLELIESLEELLGRRIKYSFYDWRLGDQKIFISDSRKAKRDFGWMPQVTKGQGIKLLLRWVQDNEELFC